MVKLFYGIIMPLWCRSLGRIDTEPDFTVGYHVPAKE